MPIKALTVILPLAGLLLFGCARSETPEQAREAAQKAQAEYARMAAEQRSNSAEDEIVGSVSPGQIDTSGGQLTAGSWTVTTIDGEQVARFGEDANAPVLTIACELGGGIDMRLPGISPEGGSSSVYIASPDGGSTFTASDTVDDEPQTYISIPASDPFLARLMSGNGPFSLRMGSDARVTFPDDDVLTSLVSTCDRRQAEAIPDSGGADSAAPEGADE